MDGQNIRFDHLDINNGLSQNSAFCMDMDKNGYLWVGTLNGLNRYNGYSFEVFKPSLNKKGSLHGSLCVDLCADNQGNTWVVTRDGGLNKYDASRQEFVYYPDSLFKQLSSKYINSIQADNNNHIWLKANKGVLCFNPQDSTAAYLLQQHKIQDITLLPNGNIAAYGSFGIFEMLQNNDGTYTTVHRIHEAVNGIAFSNKNTVVLHPDRIAFYTDLQSPSDQHFLFADIKNHIPITVNPAICVDSTKIWIGGNDGLIQYEHTDNHIICHRHQYNAANPHSFRGYIVTKILKDSGGNLWIGTAKHGINFISKRNNAFKHFNWQQNHVTDQEIDLIRAICVSSQHEYWVGFDRRDLGIIHPDGRQTLITDYEDENGEKHPLRNVRAIFEDQTKNIWVAMLHGICIYNRKKTN
ncbi:ligand-binding sensor domain-containing protein [Saccharicrinis fermentans]|uniref:ligand-binding sensor domain-containing protein n=1 Tax=Saccharicrinis fermentans TaxID=982 RepID=UPI0005C60A8B|nr:two-component regulator propeller domain-containing protein [Saccharicrinis fermentans]